MSPRSEGIAEAHRLAKEISKECRLLPRGTLDAIGPTGSSIRREVEEALLIKDRLIKSTILTSYTSNARFVFELLQIADDNVYSRTMARGEEPYVSFKVSRDTVIMECNGDGFRETSLRAICAVGKSSKSGCEPILMAAWKLHIEPSKFSFTFIHERRDSGVGMISSEWCDSNETPHGSFTRITLYLRQNGDEVERERRFQEIVSQFNDLQGTLLLFLRNLRQLRILFDEDIGAGVSNTTFSLHGENPVTIRRTVSGGYTHSEDRFYHISKHVARDVPPSENRICAKEPSEADRQAEIVLAFPVTEDSKPIVNDQDVFAFLPIKPIGFKFLIHTDFVTEASRQGIVTTSPRNQALRDGIADCFMKAIEQFCDHPTLQFQWMIWLPQAGTYPWDSFWQGLLQRLKTGIIRDPLLRNSTNQLDHIESLRILEDQHRDDSGAPLFADLPKSLYVSEDYGTDDLKLLKPYGLEVLKNWEVMTLLQHDLTSSESSRMRNQNTNDEWHSRTAWLIISCSLEGSQFELLRQLHIIPLDTGKWVTSLPSHGNLYFPTCEGALEIPQGLGLQLVDPVASANSERRSLFKRLGVPSATVQTIQGKIFSLPAKGNISNASLVRVDVAHLEYLYRSQGLNGANFDSSKFEDYKVYTTGLSTRQPHRSACYLKTKHPLEPFELCFHAFEESFIRDEYLERPPVKPPHQKLDWKEWLCQYLCIKQEIVLFTSTVGNSRRLSSVFTHVLLNHPREALSVLIKWWDQQDEVVRRDPVCINLIKGTKVLCTDGRLYPLSETYLPLPGLEQEFSRFSVDEIFPFLKLPGEVKDGDFRGKWGSIVDTFGVGFQKDLKFYLHILKTLVQHSKSYKGERSVKNPRRLIDLYRSIYGACQSSANREEAYQIVRNFDSEINAVLITEEYQVIGERCVFRSRNNCVWDGPWDMKYYCPLKQKYQQFFHPKQDEMLSLEQYLKTVLRVPDVTWRELVDEICHVARPPKETKYKDEGLSYWSDMHELYRSLDVYRKEMPEVDAQRLRQMFHDRPMIYFKDNKSLGWYTADQCIWSNTIDFQGRVSLNNHLYPDLEDFMVEFVGVERLTLSMAYEELKIMGSGPSAPSLEDAKQKISIINSLLQETGPDYYPDPAPLLTSKVLPVRYPHSVTKLVSAKSVDFAIADRLEFRQAFQDRIKMLDFSLDETRKLRPFIEWLSLKERYLSAGVKQISTDMARKRGRLLRHSSIDFNKKAYALLRIAHHYRSPRATSQADRVELYNMLRKAKIYETDDMSSELLMRQDQKVIRYKNNTKELYIREENGELEAIVPCDADRQKLCFRERLPICFMLWLMTDATTGVRTTETTKGSRHLMQSVLNAKASLVSQILRDRGIIEKVDVAEKLDNEEEVPESESASKRDETGSSSSEDGRVLTPESDGFVGMTIEEQSAVAASHFI